MSPEEEFIDEYEDDDREAEHERYVEEKLKDCVCGAYTLNSKGQLTMVADCCCGA